MTNFEFYKSEFEILDYDYVKIANAHPDLRVDTMSEFIKWLYAEHIEPIMLEQWEYDVLKVYAQEPPFMVFDTLCDLKAMGHFRGITDTSMTLQEILDRVEIIDYNTCKGCKYEDVREDDGACRSCGRYYEDLYERE